MDDVKLQFEGTSDVRSVSARRIPSQLEVGEGPRWDPHLQEWTCIDISTGGFFVGLESGSPAVTFPAPLGCTARHVSGAVLGACRDGLYSWDGITPPAKFAHLPTPLKQLNDGRCDAMGRWWIGGVGLGDDDGCLMRLDLDGSLEVVAGGYALPNGIDWFAEAGVMLHADSYSRRIFAYDFDLESGCVENRRVWWQGTKDDGLPDGLCIADDGTVWVAFWGGHVVRQLDSTGSTIRELRTPMSQPSSVTFGGPSGSQMFITSAWADLEPSERAEQPWAGDGMVIEGLGRSNGDADCLVPITALSSSRLDG
ncbi:SMP-30/gluconolactonase/LRE family protein [Marisediminicola antarctica]|nr:SMP-30/gluconolactonase/LRE family protein [Marisediminicola antarctica]